MTYLISHDLDGSNEHYEELTNAIKSLGGWANLTKSCWCVTSDLSAKDIRNHLVKIVNRNDKLFVAKLSGEAAWHGLTENVRLWLKKH
ncbi:SinR family protein [Lactiplantibacillus plantarum]|nr:SinR family protein [Lactiplantibacillus plantarum]MCT4461845.1 SinR family protein [Lactiplantibacillus plantarum]QBX94246.1 SinR family protein [Lactiplantibacillus plantarum]